MNFHPIFLKQQLKKVEWYFTFFFLMKQLKQKKSPSKIKPQNKSISHKLIRIKVSYPPTSRFPFVTGCSSLKRAISGKKVTLIFLKPFPFNYLCTTKKVALT